MQLLIWYSINFNKNLLNINSVKLYFLLKALKLMFSIKFPYLFPVTNVNCIFLKYGIEKETVFVIDISELKVKY